jgi:hypothetical protein
LASDRVRIMGGKCCCCCRQLFNGDARTLKLDGNLGIRVSHGHAVAGQERPRAPKPHIINGNELRFLPVIAVRKSRQIHYIGRLNKAETALKGARHGVVLQLPMFGHLISMSSRPAHRYPIH